MKNLLHTDATAGRQWVLDGIHHALGDDSSKVAEVLDKASAAAIPWLNIAKIVIPLVLKVMLGEAVTADEIVAAVQSLIGPTTAPATAS